MEVPSVDGDKRDWPQLNCHGYGGILKDRFQLFWKVFWLDMSGVWGCMVVVFNGVVVVVVVERKKSTIPASIKSDWW